MPITQVIGVPLPWDNGCQEITFPALNQYNLDILWTARSGSLIGPIVTNSTGQRSSYYLNGTCLTGPDGCAGLEYAPQSLFGTSWTEIGELQTSNTTNTINTLFHVNGNAILFYPFSTSFYGFQIRHSGGALPLIKVAPSPIGTIRYAIRRRGTEFYCWVNGILIATAIDFNASDPEGTGNTAGIGGTLDNISSYSIHYESEGVSLVARTSSELSENLCLELSRNPWTLVTGNPLSVPKVSTITIYYPNSDIAVSGWTGSPDNTNLYNNIDEAIGSTTDYVQSPPITGFQGPADFALSGSVGVGTWEVDCNFKYTLSAASVKYTLLNAGGTSVGDSGWIAASSVFAGYTPTITISAGTATKLRVEVQ